MFGGKEGDSHIILIAMIYGIRKQYIYAFEKVFHTLCFYVGLCIDLSGFIVQFRYLFANKSCILEHN